MKLPAPLKLINSRALDVLRKSISETIAAAPQYITKVREYIASDKVKEEKKKLMYDKVISLNNWYTKVIGLDEVRLYQEKVTSLQEQLLNTQMKRREVGRQLADIRQKSLELQDQIHKVKRQDNLEQFLELMTQETEILKLENSIARTFQDYDQAERELFTAFCNAIRDSHEKQRAQIEYTKYFGLILSITGSFLAFVYTTLKKNELKKFIEEKLLVNNNPSTITNNSLPTLINLVEEIKKIQKAEIQKAEIQKADIQRVQSQKKVIGNQDILLTIKPSQQTDSLSTDDWVKVIGGVCLTFIVLKILFN